MACADCAIAVNHVPGKRRGLLPIELGRSEVDLHAICSSLLECNMALYSHLCSALAALILVSLAACSGLEPSVATDQLVPTSSAPPASTTTAVTPAANTTASPTRVSSKPAPSLAASDTPTVPPTRSPETPTAVASATRAPLSSPVPVTLVPTPPAISVTLPITTWHTVTLLVGPGRPGRLYALQTADVARPTSDYTEAVRFLVSGDDGTSWSLFEGGLPTTDVSCLANVNLDYATTDSLYASTCHGLYRWTGKWQLISEQRTGMVAILYGRPNIVWATGKYPDPYILRSEDGARTWQRADYDLDSFSGQFNLAIDPRDNKTLYSMINPKYAGSYLRRGDPTGHWVTMPVPERGYTYVGMTIDGATGALYVATLIGAAEGINAHWQLWRTPNPTEPDMKNVRWELVHDFGEDSAGQWVMVLASGWSPQGLALYVRFDLGNCSPLQGIICTSLVQRSTDGGQSWTPLALPTR